VESRIQVDISRYAAEEREGWVLDRAEVIRKLARNE
jgi:hypothetical protein